MDTSPDDNVTSYTYDSAGRLATETSPTGGVTTYTYDLADNLTQTVDPDGHIIQYAHDADDRETTERWISDGSTIMLENGLKSTIGLEASRRHDPLTQRPRHDASRFRPKVCDDTLNAIRLCPLFPLFVDHVPERDA